MSKHPVLTTPLQEIEDVENERSMMTPVEVAERYNRLTVGAEPWLELALDDLPQLESIKGEQKQTHMQHDILTVGTSTWPNFTDGIREGLSSMGIPLLIA